jgi:hypothetical protein
MSKNKIVFDGGPAFPLKCEQGEVYGLSKREWFAGMALQGLLTQHQYADGICAMSAQRAVSIADAMLEELK